MKVYSPNHGRDLSNDNLLNIGSQGNVSRMTKMTSEYTLDISGGDKDIKAFGMEELKSAGDIRNKMSVKDVSLEQNALAVMSNSMSGEDLAKLQKDGFQPSDMNSVETVTSLDKIKAKLAASGVVIPGYTDDLSSDQLEAITGSVSAANAIENALKNNQIPVNRENVVSVNDVIKLSEKTEPLTDDAKKYMINNDLKPSVSNIYMANHSSSDANAGGRASFYINENGYVGKNGTDLNMDELKPQVEKIIKDAGLKVNDTTMKSAQWLIEKNLPVTEDNLKNLQDINSIQFPISEKIVADSSAAAIADGYEAKEAVLTNTESMVVKAGKMIEMVNDALKDVAGDKSSEAKSQSSEKAFDPLSKMRLVEEIRLHLTLEANLQLLKKGISIDTSDLEKTVETLKQAEKEAYAPFLMKDKEINAEDIAKYKDIIPENVRKYDEELTFKIDLYKKTSEAVRDIMASPVEFAAEIAMSDGTGASEKDTSFGYFAKRATALKSEYDRAGKSYETMMTAPRADMGDSIRKAFRNVDDILEDLELETTRLNEKAVRILGYAGIEINEGNIDKAVTAEVAVENIISHMTPARTLKMIRDGENPLEKDIYELSEELMKEDEEESLEKYSEFIVRLEKSGEITEAEKKSFIGMYRLFRKIEKSDGKLVGDVLKADTKLTFENLIQASRSDRQVGTDIKIDDSFGAMERLITHGESITDQILSGLRADKEAEQKFLNEKVNEIRQAVKAETAVLEVLDNISEPHSPVNMAAVDMLINQRGSLFRTLRDKVDEEHADEIVEEFKNIRDSFDDEESVNRAYSNFEEKASEIIKETAELTDKYIDVRSLSLVGKQISVIGKLANEHTYEVPVEINGEMTSINLKLVSDSENAGKVSASFTTETTGKVSAEFTLKNGEVTGFIVTENSYFEGVVKEKEEAFRNEFEAAGVRTASMYHTSSRGLSIKGNYVEKGNRNTPANTQLYKVAKAIIKSVQK